MPIEPTILENLWYGSNNSSWHLWEMLCLFSVSPRAEYTQKKKKTYMNLILQ